MPAIVRNIEIEIGSRWFSSVRLLANGSPYDLTGATAKMQIRDLDGNLLAELSTETGEITIDTAAGRIDRELLASATAAITVDAGLYDLEIYPGGDTEYAWKLYRGKVKFTPEQTRDE